MAMKTEIIVENDEMEDGSIFVCFMCEQEFSKVSLLNEHMQTHQDMPEMSKEFPARPRRGRGTTAVRKPRGSGSSRARGRGRGRGQGRGVPIPVLPEIKQEEPKEVYIKQEPDDGAVKKAQRIRQFFQSRLMSAGKAPKKSSMSFDGGEDGFDDTFGAPLAEEEIMMVPQPMKKKGSAPTVMIAEPEGFHTPAPTKPKLKPVSTSSSAASTTTQKKVKLRKKLIVQEVVYEEVEEDEDGRETVKSVTSLPVSHSSNYTVVKRGSLRKVSVDEDEDEEEKEEMELLEDDEPPEDIEDEEGGYIELSEDDEVMEFPVTGNRLNSNKPGRRSQPRNSDSCPGVPCEVCGKEFRSVITLRVHMRSHLEVKYIPCPYCDEVFPQRHVLQQHLVKEHEESNNLTCSVCGKIFTRTDSLKSHMVRMHEEDGGLNCYICGKNFPSQGQLEMHVRVHTGERPFKCEYCNKGFVQKVHLRTHLRTMHNMQEVQNTPCRICNAKLDGRSGLRDHYNSVHGLTNSQYKTRVAKLRKEGKIPELPPPVVKEVDPSLNYYKVSIAELTGAPSTSTTTTPVRKRVAKKASRGRPRKVAKVIDSDSSSMETTTYCDADSTYGAMEVKFEVDDSAPKRRDQEELNIVESAFKVAEQMDQLGANVPGSTTILVAGEDSETTGVYYAIPVVMENSTSSGSTTTSTVTTTSTKTSTTAVLQTAPTSSNQEATPATVTSTVTANGTPMISTTTSDASSLHSVHFGQEEIDPEYAQFAAEHSHMEDDFQTESLNNKGSIVKAEPLRLFTDPDDPSQSETVEMFTM